MLWTMLSMGSEEVAFVISNSSRALILLGSFSKCRIVIVFFHWPHLVSHVQHMFRECILPRRCGEVPPVFIKSGFEISFCPAYVKLVAANRRDYDDPTLRERPKKNQRSRRVGNYESDHFQMHAQHSPQHQPSLPDTIFSSGLDNSPCRQQLMMPLSW